MVFDTQENIFFLINKEQNFNWHLSEDKFHFILLNWTISMNKEWPRLEVPIKIFKPFE